MAGTLVDKLGDIASELSAITSMECLNSTVTKIIESVVPVEYLGLYFYHKQEGKLVMHGYKGFTQQEKEEAERTAKHRHPGWVFENEKMLYIKDTKLDKSGNSYDSKRNFVVRSRLWLPVLVHKEAVGAFGFASIHPNNFNEMHINTLRFVSNLAGVIFNNIQLIEAQKKQNHKLIETKNLLMLMRL